MMHHDTRFMGVSLDDLGGGVKKFTARIMPDMLGAKIGTKRVPVRAPNTLTISNAQNLSFYTGLGAK